MHLQHDFRVAPRSVALASLVLLCFACSDSAPSSDDAAEGGHGGSGPKGGAAGSAGIGAAGSAGSSGGSAGAPNSGGTTSGASGATNSGGAASGAAGTSSGASGAPNAGGTTSGGNNAGGAASGAGGAASGASGATSSGGTAGAAASGAGGTTAGAGAGAGQSGSGSGGVSGGGGSSGAGAGAGGGPTSTRSPGCGTAVQRPNPRTQQTMEIGGTTRYYLLDVPANADNETPLTLVFGLHGYDMNNVAVVDLFNFTSRSNGRAITVLPQGEGPPPGDVSHWGDNVLQSRWTANETNYTFIRTLMLDLQERFCIDLTRVFITGFSMGGFFTNSLACAHSDWFRAYAPVAGGGPGSCANASAKPAIIIHHGTADNIVGIDSGEASRDFWVEQNGCSNTTSPSLSGCQSYGGCPDGSPVAWCVGNWDHTISGTAAANIWSFFDAFE